MQALFIFSLFTFVLTLMGTIITFGTKSAEALTAERAKETLRFFEAVATVVKNDVTQKYLEANPHHSTTIANYIKDMPEVAAMSAGYFSSIGLDSWGKPLQGALVTNAMPITVVADPDSLVYVPVTAFALVSSGPDGILQTAVPSNPTTLTQVRSIVAPTDAAGRPTSDDIVYTFDNREDQMRVLQTLHAHMEHIGSASLKEYQYRVTDFRNGLVAAYEADVAAGKAVSPPDMDLSGHTGAPKLLALDTAANRMKLGVDDDIRELERKLAGGGRLVLTAAAPVKPNDPLMLTLSNGSPVSPWGTAAQPMKYVVRVYPDKI